MTKALREAKVHTSWLSPDEDYETAVLAVRATRSRSAPRTVSSRLFEPFQARVAELGIYNSLAQLLIKITAPGVPTSIRAPSSGICPWSIPTTGGRSTTCSRREALAEIGSAARRRSCSPVGPTAASRCSWPAAALAARAQWRDLYEQGDYVPLRSPARCGTMRSRSRASVRD